MVVVGVTVAVVTVPVVTVAVAVVTVAVAVVTVADTDDRCQRHRPTWFRRWATHRQGHRCHLDFPIWTMLFCLPKTWEKKRG